MYYVISNGTQCGPYALDKIRRLVAAGQLKAEDIAWAEGMTKKVRLHALLENPGNYVPPPNEESGSPEGCVPSARPCIKSGIAMGSLLLGVVALIFASSIYVRLFPIAIAIYMGLGAGLGAVILGHLGRRGIMRSHGRMGGAGSALAGLICGYLAIAPSLLTAITAYGYTSIKNKGLIAKAKNNIQTIVSYIDMYASLARSNRRPPANIQDLVTQRFIVDESLLTDPWGELIQYKIPAVRSQGKFDVWSNGPDHISGNEDDIGNWQPD
jgi:hypothetical protein